MAHHLFLPHLLPDPTNLPQIHALLLTTLAPIPTPALLSTLIPGLNLQNTATREEIQKWTVVAMLTAQENTRGVHALMECDAHTREGVQEMVEAVKKNKK